VLSTLVGCWPNLAPSLAALVLVADEQARIDTFSLMPNETGLAI